MVLLDFFFSYEFHLLYPDLVCISRVRFLVAGFHKFVIQDPVSWLLLLAVGFDFTFCIQMLLLAVLISFMLLLTVVDIEFWNVCEEWVYWFDFILLL